MRQVVYNEGVRQTKPTRKERKMKILNKIMSVAIIVALVVAPVFFSSGVAGIVAVAVSMSAMAAVASSL
jgi:hypothetical protein